MPTPWTRPMLLLSGYVILILEQKVTISLDLLSEKSRGIAEKTRKLLSRSYMTQRNSPVSPTQITKLPTLHQSFVVYEFSCSGCNSKYIGKTERTLTKRKYEHAWSDNNSAIKRHIDNCEGVLFIQSLMKFDMSPSNMNVRESHVNLVNNSIWCD